MRLSPGQGKQSPFTNAPSALGSCGLATVLFSWRPFAFDYCPYRATTVRAVTSVHDFIPETYLFKRYKKRNSKFHGPIEANKLFHSCSSVWRFNGARYCWPCVRLDTRAKRNGREQRNKPLPRCNYRRGRGMPGRCNRGGNAKGNECLLAA